MSYQTCIRCIIDTTVPGVKFDEKGECSYCKIHDKLDKQYPANEKGKKRLDNIIKKIKARGRNNRYDCVTGVSGGRDSTYILYLAKQLGLNPLAVHFNDGFGNPVAGENMKKATQRLNVELRTVTSDWPQSKDLKLAFLKASTPDVEIGTDIGIATALYSVCVKENIKFILTGHSFRTEGISPLEWCYLD
jgi:tRNA(Ile)-lysidine synthase TilS/MesJ